MADFETGCRDWLKDQFQASYKGIPFDVDSDTRGGGRRLVRHEYPGRETGDTEDMGKATEGFTVEGYVTGDDAKLRAEALYIKCSGPGPGMLILPMRRPVVARCGLVQSTFVGDQLGRFLVVMEFIIEQKPKGGMFFKTFALSKMKDAIDRATKIINEDFSVNFDTIRRGFSSVGFVPAVARLRAAQEIPRAADAIAFANASVPVFRGREASKVELAIRTMRERPVSLAFRGQKPNRYESDMFVVDQEIIRSGLAGTVSNAIRRIAEQNNTPDLAFGAITKLVDFQPEPIDKPPTFVPRSIRAEEALAGEVARLVRRHALIRLAGIVARRTYATKAAAVSARGLLAQQFEIELRGIADAALNGAMNDVAASAGNFLSELALALPSTMKVKTQWELPACVIATALYKDASKDRALIAFNGASIHPLFMPVEFEAPQNAN